MSNQLCQALTVLPVPDLQTNTVVVIVVAVVVVVVGWSGAVVDHTHLGRGGVDQEARGRGDRGEPGCIASL